MVLSGTTNEVTGSVYTSNKFYITWSGRQNIEGNYTDVTASFYLKPTYSTAWFQSEWVSATININGTAMTWSGNHSMSYPNILTIMTTTVKVPHNSDGTKSFTISGSVSIPGYTGTASIGNNSFTLNTIPRKSSMTISTSNLEIGSNCTVNVNSASGSFYHYIQFNIPGQGTQFNLGQGGGSKTFTFPTSLATFITSGTSTTCSFRLITSTSSTGWDNGALIGYGDYNGYTLNVPASMVPTVSTLTYADTISAVTTVTGSNQILVQGKSNVILTAEASGVQGSTITDYSFTSSNGAFSSSGPLTAAILDLSKVEIGTGTQTITVTATDTRGRTSTKTVDLTIRAYSPPRITNVGVARVTTATSTIRVLKTVSIASVSNSSGTNANTYTVTIKTRKNGTMDWTTSNTESNTSAASVDLSSFDTSSSWEVIITAVDKFGDDSVRATVPTTKILFDLNQDIGIGVGKFHEKGILDVYGDVYLSGGSYYKDNELIQSHALTESSGNALYRPPTYNLDSLSSKTGFFRGDSLSNRLNPPGSHNWQYVRLTTHDDSWHLQEAVDFNGVMSAFRVKSAGSWKPWQQYAIQKTTPEFTGVRYSKEVTRVVNVGWGMSLSFTRVGGTVHVVTSSVTTPSHPTNLIRRPNLIPVGFTPAKRSPDGSNNSEYYTPITHLDAGFIPGSILIMQSDGGIGLINKGPGKHIIIGMSYPTLDEFPDDNPANVVNRNLLSPGAAKAAFGATSTYSASDDTYTVTGVPAGDIWGTGLELPQIVVPYGESYRFSAEFFCTTSIRIINDFNNGITGVSVSINDNDNTSKRVVSTNASGSLQANLGYWTIPANTWTKIWWGSNNDASSNSGKLDITVSDNFGISRNTITANTVFKVRKAKFEYGAYVTG